MKTFLEKVKSNILDKNKKISASRLLWYFRKNPTEREMLKSYTPNCDGDENFMERIFWIENDLTEYLKCVNPDCNINLVGITRWKDSNYLTHTKEQHFMTCSNKCKHQLHSFRNDEVHAKRIETFKNKYGVENSAQLDTNSFKADNPMKKDECVEKAKRTCIDKYGVDNPSKSEQIMDKVVKSGYGAKDYIFPSGKVVRIRGYEWKALDELLEKYDESEIEVSAKKMPKIKYLWEDGTEHYYFPDIFIEKENLLIEVKSDYYMRKDFEKNQRKAVATKRDGYNFKFMVYGS